MMLLKQFPATMARPIVTFSPCGLTLQCDQRVYAELCDAHADFGRVDIEADESQCPPKITRVTYCSFEDSKRKENEYANG